MRTIRVLVTQGWEFEYANVLTYEQRSDYSKCSYFTICHMSDFWTFRLSSLKAGYKSSDQTSWRLKTKLWIWFIGTTCFDQRWSSSGYNSDFWNSHPCGADLPRIFFKTLIQHDFLALLGRSRKTERINKF